MQSVSPDATLKIISGLRLATYLTVATVSNKPSSAFNCYISSFALAHRRCFLEKRMNNSKTRQRPVFAAVATGSLALALIGFAGAAQARDNISFSIGLGVPGVQLGVSNAYPVYAQPQPIYVQPQPVYIQPRPVYVQPEQVYIQPRPVYVQPAPVYFQPRPVYYNAPPVYVVPQPAYQGRPHHINRGWNNGYGGYYGQQRRESYGDRREGYGSVYYSR